MMAMYWVDEVHDMDVVQWESMMVIQWDLKLDMTMELMMVLCWVYQLVKLKVLMTVMVYN